MLLPFKSGICYAASMQLFACIAIIQATMAPLSNASTETSPTRGVQVWSPARSVTDAEADEFPFSLRDSLPQYGRDFDDDPISDTGD